MSTSMSLKDACILNQPGQEGASKKRADQALSLLYQFFCEQAQQIGRWKSFRERMDQDDWDEVIFDLLLWKSNRLPTLREKLLSGEMDFASDRHARSYLRTMLDLATRDYLRKRDKIRQVAIDDHSLAAPVVVRKAPEPELEVVKELLDQLAVFAIMDATRSDKKRNIIPVLTVAWQLKLKTLTAKAAMKKLGCSRDALYKRCDRLRKTLKQALENHPFAFDDAEQRQLRIAIKQLSRRQLSQAA